MSYSFNAVLKCTINTIPTNRAVACNNEAAELLRDSFGEIVLPTDSIEERCDLMLACGASRTNAHVLMCDTIIIQGNRSRSNVIDFSIRCKFKSLGYKTMMFDNNDVVVYTKNAALVSALSRRPFDCDEPVEKDAHPAPVSGVLLMLSAQPVTRSITRSKENGK